MLSCYVYRKYMFSCLKEFLLPDLMTIIDQYTRDTHILVLGGVQSPHCELLTHVSGEHPQWKPFIDLTQQRSGAFAACIDQKIFLVGGFLEGGVVTNSVEMLDLNFPHSCWINVASMSKRRNCAGGWSFHGNIYIWGGANEIWHNLDCGEVYKPATNRWEHSTAKLLRADFRFGTAVLGDRLYKLGRYEDCCYYEPLGQKKWISIAPLQIKRCIVTACTLGSKIYVGGDSTQVEVYNPQVNKWEFLGGMQFLTKLTQSTFVAANSVAFFVCGGFDRDQRKCQVWTGRDWRKIDPFVHTRSHYAICLLD